MGNAIGYGSAGIQTHTDENVLSYRSGVGSPGVGSIRGRWVLPSELLYRLVLGFH